MNPSQGVGKCGLDESNLFLIYATDAGVIKELEQDCKGKGLMVADCALLRYLGIGFDISGFNYTQKSAFGSICRANDYNAKKFKAGKIGGLKSGEVRAHQAECRAYKFKDREDMLGALRCSSDPEIVIQAAMEYCRRRPELKFERALRKRLKVIGAYRFGDLCEGVITKEKEPNNRSNAIVGVLNKAVQAQVKADEEAQKTEQECQSAQEVLG